MSGEVDGGGRGTGGGRAWVAGGARAAADGAGSGGLA